MMSTINGRLPDLLLWLGRARCWWRERLLSTTIFCYVEMMTFFPRSLKLDNLYLATVTVKLVDTADEIIEIFGAVVGFEAITYK